MSESDLRCPSSVSGTCLAMTQGFEPCMDSCAYAPECEQVPPSDSGRFLAGGTDQIARVHWDDHILTVIQHRTRPAISVGDFSAWTFTDLAGHEHSFGTKEGPYPTLVRISDGWAGPPDYDEDDDTDSEFEYYHLSCGQCGEIVWPADGGPETEYLPGAFDYLIDGEPVNRDAAREFAGQLHAGDPDKWKRLYGWLKYSSALLPPVQRRQPVT